MSYWGGAWGVSWGTSWGAVGDEKDHLVAGGLETGAPALSTPALVEIPISTVDDLVSQSLETGSPALGQPSLSSGEVVVNFNANSLTLYEPPPEWAILKQFHILSYEGIDSASPGLSEPDLLATGFFEPDDILTADPELGQFHATQIYLLQAQSIQTGGVSFEGFNLIEYNDLTANGIETQPFKVNSPFVDFDGIVKQLWRRRLKLTVGANIGGDP